MAEPSQQPRLDMYAQDLLRQSYQAMPISQDILSQYGQGMAQQVQPPEIQNYAPQQASMPQQQFAQQAPQQQMLQPDTRRLAYNKLIEDRFNELANQFGGMKRLVEMDSVELAKKKAAADIASYWGPPPTAERPLNQLERVQLEKEKLALKQAEKTLGKVETEQAKIETDKLKSAQENIGLASDVVASVDKLLADENALQWAGGKSGALFGSIPGSQTKGIRQQIDQLRDQIGLFGRKAIVGQGQGSISDAEQKMAKEALSQVITEGTDEQLIQSLKAVRQKFGGILDRIQSEASGQPVGQPMSQPAGQPKVRTFVPGKGFQD